MLQLPNINELILKAHQYRIQMYNFAASAHFFYCYTLRSVVRSFQY